MVRLACFVIRDPRRPFSNAVYPLQVLCAPRLDSETLFAPIAAIRGRAAARQSDLRLTASPGTRRCGRAAAPCTLRAKSSRGHNRVALEQPVCARVTHSPFRARRPNHSASFVRHGVLPAVPFPASSSIPAPARATPTTPSPESDHANPATTQLRATPTAAADGEPAHDDAVRLSQHRLRHPIPIQRLAVASGRHGHGRRIRIPSLPSVGLVPAKFHASDVPTVTASQGRRHRHAKRCTPVPATAEPHERARLWQDR